MLFRAAILTAFLISAVQLAISTRTDEAGEQMRQLQKRSPAPVGGSLRRFLGGSSSRRNRPSEAQPYQHVEAEEEIETFGFGPEEDDWERIDLIMNDINHLKDLPGFATEVKASSSSTSSSSRRGKSSQSNQHSAQPNDEIMSQIVADEPLQINVLNDQEAEMYRARYWSNFHQIRNYILHRTDLTLDQARSMTNRQYMDIRGEIEAAASALSSLKRRYRELRAEANY